jgi:hypothetical protein
MYILTGLTLPSRVDILCFPTGTVTVCLPKLFPPKEKHNVGLLRFDDDHDHIGYRFAQVRMYSDHYILKRNALTKPRVLIICNPPLIITNFYFLNIFTKFCQINLKFARLSLTAHSKKSTNHGA